MINLAWRAASLAVLAAFVALHHRLEQRVRPAPAAARQLPSWGAIDTVQARGRSGLSITTRAEFHSWLASE